MTPLRWRSSSWSRSFEVADAAKATKKTAARKAAQQDKVEALARPSEAPSGPADQDAEAPVGVRRRRRRREDSDEAETDDETKA